ncbi:NUDIX hydrolase, partial [Actinoplanes italicus]
MSYVGELRELVGQRPLLLAAAGVIVVDEVGRWLLQRRVDDDLWGLIGGALELGESFEDAARRELLEESGLVAESLERLDVYSGPDFQLTYPRGDRAYVVGVTFLAGRVAGTAVADGEEGSELGWFSPDHLPVLSGYNGLLITRARALLADRRDQSAQSGPRRTQREEQTASTGPRRADRGERSERSRPRAPDRAEWTAETTPRRSDRAERT